MTRTIEILIGLLGKYVSFMAYEIIPVKLDGFSTLRSIGCSSLHRPALFFKPWPVQRQSKLETYRKSPVSATLRSIVYQANGQIFNNLVSNQSWRRFVCGSRPKYRFFHRRVSDVETGCGKSPVPVECKMHFAFNIEKTVEKALMEQMSTSASAK